MTIWDRETLKYALSCHLLFDVSSEISGSLPYDVYPEQSATCPVTRNTRNTGKLRKTPEITGKQWKKLGLNSRAFDDANQ